MKNKLLPLLILTLLFSISIVIAEPTQVNITQESSFATVNFIELAGFNQEINGLLVQRSSGGTYGYLGYSLANYGSDIGDYATADRDVTHVSTLNEWYTLSRQTNQEGEIRVLNNDYNESIAVYSGYTGAIVITDDEKYIYVGYTNGVVKKYDFNMQLVEQVKGVRGTNYFTETSGLVYVESNKAFLEKRGTELKVFDENYNQYGSTHNVGIGLSQGGLETNGTHIFTQNPANPDLNNRIYIFNIAEQNILPPVNVVNTIPIYKGNKTINLTISGRNPLSHAQDNNYQYILGEGLVSGTNNTIQIIDSWSSDYLSHTQACGLLGITDDNQADLKFLGLYEDSFLLRSNDNTIYQLSTIDCSPINTQYLTGVIDAGDLKVIGEQLYVMSNEGRILVYTINKNLNGIISYIYQYEFAVNQNIDYANSYITGNNNYLYIIDSTTQTIYLYDILGSYKEAYSISDWNYLNTPKDIFFYNNDFYIIASDESLAKQYVLPNPNTQGYQELGGVNYSTTSYCVTDTILCDDVTHTIQGDGSIISTCNGNAQECPQELSNGGCNNEYDTNNVLSGSCGVISCTQECPLTNVVSCNGINTYTICGNYDADVCNENGVTLYCPLGQTCVEDGLNSGCEATPTTSNLLPQLIITKNVKSTNSIEVSQVDNTYYLSSALQTAYLGFNILTTPTQATYSSYIQDYKETLLISDKFEDITTWNGDTVNTQVDNNNRTHEEISKDKTISKDFTQKTGNKRITYDFNLKQGELNKEGQLYVQLNDDNNSQVDELYFQYYKNTHSLQVSRSNNGIKGAEIFTDTGLSDNLYSIHVEVTINDQIDDLYYFITVFRTINGEVIPYRYFTKPYAYTDTNTNSISTISFTSKKEKFDLYGFEVYEIPNFNTYSSVDSNNDLQEKYTYSTTGCTTNRLYANEYAIPTYHFYDEFEICVVGVNSLINNDLQDQQNLANGNSDLEKLFGTTFSTNDKALISIVFIALAFGVFYLVFRETKESWILGLGVLISGLMVFYFALIGYLPSWIVIMLIIIAVGISSIALKNSFAR